MSAASNMKDRLIRDLYIALLDEVYCHGRNPGNEIYKETTEIIDKCKRLGYGDGGWKTSEMLRIK